jgi:hypothetical protein
MLPGQNPNQKFAEYLKEGQLRTDKKAIVSFTGVFRKRQCLTIALRPNAICSPILNSVSCILNSVPQSFPIKELADLFRK